MDSEEWRFLLNFAENQQDDAKDIDNGDCSQQATTIGNSLYLDFSESNICFIANMVMLIFSDEKLDCLTDDVRCNMKKLIQLNQFTNLLAEDSNLQVSSRNICQK